MVRTLLVRGMLAGLLAGLLAFAFASAFGETQVDHAIAFESAHDLAIGMKPEPAIVSRSVQGTLGLAIGTSLYGVGFGGMFALVFAGIFGRVGRPDPRRAAALLALAGFVVIVLVPFLKYPANPPSIGHPDTLAKRSELFLVMIAISIAAAITATRVHRNIAKQRDGWAAGIASAAALIVIVAVAELVLPTVNEVPRAFPATVLWHFRLASLGTQLTMWTSIGIGFGVLAQRALAPTGSEPRNTVSRPSIAPPT